MQPHAGQPRFRRFANTYSKLLVQGLVEYECVLLMDADTVVVGPMDELVDCSSGRPDALMAGVQDYKRGRWRTFNTGVLRYRPSASELSRAIGLLLNSTARYQSDQTFINLVYPEGSGAVSLLPFMWNAMTHVQVQLPRFWASLSTPPAVLHFTEKKGWQCEERLTAAVQLLGQQPVVCGQLNGQNLTMPHTDVACFCESAHEWWRAYRRAEDDWLWARVSPQTQSRTVSAQ